MLQLEILACASLYAFHVAAPGENPQRKLGEKLSIMVSFFCKLVTLFTQKGDGLVCVWGGGVRIGRSKEEDSF